MPPRQDFCIFQKVQQARFLCDKTVPQAKVIKENADFLD